MTPFDKDEKAPKLPECEPYVVSNSGNLMKKQSIRYVNCAHCGARMALEEAVHYEHRLIYGEHYHCRECDPKGLWDCMSHDTDLEVH